MGVSGRIKIGRPGWLLAEGHAGVMDVFTRRVKLSRMKDLLVMWQDTDTLTVGPYESPYRVLNENRLFRDGMYEVAANDFGKDLINAGLDEALKLGTGLNFKHLYDELYGEAPGKGKGKAKNEAKGKAKGKGKGKKKH